MSYNKILLNALNISNFDWFFLYVFLTKYLIKFYLLFFLIHIYLIVEFFMIYENESQ